MKLALNLKAVISQRLVRWAWMAADTARPPRC